VSWSVSLEKTFEFPADGARDVDQRPQRSWRTQWVAAAGQQADRRRDRPAELADQGGLPYAGFTSDEDKSPFAPTRCVQESCEPIQFGRSLEKLHLRRLVVAEPRSRRGKGCDQLDARTPPLKHSTRTP